MNRVSGVVFLLLLLSAAGAPAQTSAPSSAPSRADRDTGSTEERLRRLESELRELRSRLSAPASAPAPNATGPTSSAQQATTRPTGAAQLSISGYVELFYQWSFNDPSNGITSYRAFDNRHNALTVSNAVLDATGAVGPISTRVALQFGQTPETYYLAEPSSPGTSGAGSSGPGLWKHIQQAIAAWRAPLGRGLLVEGGIFLSPIGPESMAIKDQWNWSRSGLFFALPAYHTGLRVSYPVTDRITVTLGGYNGWNSVVDNNPEKSLAVQLSYSVTDRLTCQLLYLGGVERPAGAPEGRPWRHLLDGYATWYPTRWLSLLAHGDVGFERHAFGTSWWGAVALYARARTLCWLYLAVRGDLLREGLPAGAGGVATPIFFPARWVTSGTVTAEALPHDRVSLRLEYRHDQAERAIYFRGAVEADAAGVALPNARRQDTLTLGMVAWF